jgi:hypothetical protein
VKNLRKVGWHTPQPHAFPEADARSGVAIAGSLPAEVCALTMPRYLAQLRVGKIPR